MADKAVTQYTPVEADVPIVSIRYEEGVVKHVDVALRLRSSDSSETTRRREVRIDASELSAGQITTLNNVCVTALDKAKTKLGF
jgi:hypothetical protein